MVRRVSGSMLCTGIIDGTDAPVLEFTDGNPVLFSTDHNGVTTTSQQKNVTLRIRTAGGVGTPTTANISVASSFGNVSITKPSNGTVRLSVLANKSVTDGTISVTASASIGGKSFSASGVIAVVCNREGDPGDPGDNGRDAAVLEFTAGNPVLFRTDSSGNATIGQAPEVYFRLRTAGGTASPTAANISATSLSGITSTAISGGLRLSVSANANVTEGSITVTASASIGGKSYTASGSITIACNRMGLRGDVGPWRYFDGPWDATKQYNKSAGTPIVLAADGHRYYLYGSSSYNEDPRYNNNGSPWTLTTESFKYLVSEMIFSDNAQFGAFVFNNHWLISNSGSINGTKYLTTDKDNPARVSGEDVPAYTHFNPDLPDGKMNVPVPVGDSFITSQSVNSVYFNLRGGHTYKIMVTITGYSFQPSNPSDPLLTLDIYLRRAGNNTNLKTLTVDCNGTFVVGTYAPSADGSFRICCVSQTGLNAFLSAIVVTSSTVFIPNYAVDGLSGETYQNKCHVSGEVTANRLLASDGNFSTEITPGLAEFRSIQFPLSYLRIGADEYGMVFQMTDKNGRLIWNLGGSSNGIGTIDSGGGDYTSVYFKRLSGRYPDVSEISYVTREDCTEYYQYNGRWASANGQRQFAEGEEAKNGIVHTMKVNGTGVSLIEAGYYIKPNNGLFMMEMQDVEGSGEQKKMVYIYQFNSSGKIAGTYKIEFY